MNLLDLIVVLHWQRQVVKSFVACVEVISGINLQNDKSAYLLNKERFKVNSAN